MRSIVRSVVAVAAVVGVCFVAGCGDSALQDGGACDCRVEGTGSNIRLVMSWACYCAANDCNRQLVTTCASHKSRIDYPTCGLTVLRITPAGGPIDDVFDQNGNLVGVVVSSDLATYTCPSNPALSGSSMQAGRLPEASCAETTCGPCTDPACGGG